MTDDLRQTLLALETALVSTDATGIDGGLPALIADDFLEFGASGRIWDAATTRRLVAARPSAGSMELLDFAIDELAPGVVLATYRLGEPRPANRSSIWVHRDGRWQMRFHQGTLTAV
jgi:hypothetical protein